MYQPVFFPYKPAPHALQSHLVGLVRSANQQGYRIRIAIVQSRRDLGSVPALFGTPTVYARFLSSELSSIWRDRVLVVMPDGYGLAQDAHLVRSASGVERIKASTKGPDEAVLRHLARPAGGSPAALVKAAERALRALAARHDVALVGRAGPQARKRRRLVEPEPDARRSGLGRGRPDGGAALVPVADAPGPRLYGLTSG